MNQVVLAVNGVEAVEPSGDVRVDGAVGAGAVQHADEGAVLLPHAEDREGVLRLADSLCPLHAVVPAIQVGVIGVLGQLAVVVLDHAAAAFRNEDKPFLIGAGRAEHRQHGDIRQGVSRVIGDLIVGHLGHQLVPFQAENHHGIEERAVVFFRLRHVLHIDLILFLIVTDLGKIPFQLFLFGGLNPGFQDVEIAFLNVGIQCLQFIKVVRLAQLFGVEQGVEALDLLLVPAGHLPCQFLVAVHRNGKRDGIGPFNLTDGILDPNCLIVFLIDIEVPVHHGIPVVVQFCFVAGYGIGQVQRGREQFAVHAVGDRILVPAFRIGVPDFPVILAGHGELGCSRVHFQQQVIVLDHDVLPVSIIEDQMRFPAGRYFLFGVNWHEHK